MIRKRHDQVCADCRSDFQSVRRDARFCSDRCRKALKRTAPRNSPPTSRTKPPKPRTQLAHDIEVAKAWIEWSHDERPQI
jgi:predicted amidophosphoribosyltransferase